MLKADLNFEGIQETVKDFALTTNIRKCFSIIGVSQAEYMWKGQFCKLYGLNHVNNTIINGKDNNH